MHGVSRNLIPTVSILGVEVAAINKDWLIDFTKSHVRELSGDYICVANVHTTVTAFDDKEYMAVQNGGIMAIPDGGPLNTLGRRRGAKGMSRTTGPGYMEEVLRLSVENGWTHFFYGSTQDTLERMKVTIERDFPGIQIAGMYSPPFRPLSADEDAKIVEIINVASPDFVWVGLGAPKQERWMADHQGRVKGLMVGVGAAFDYLSGRIKRAPKWMQNSNLEWLFRLFQEPKRLTKRYVETNSKFIWNAVIRRK